MAEKDKKIVFKADDMKEVKPEHSLDLEDIRILSCFHPKEDESYFLYYCEPTEESTPLACPVCGSISISGHGYTAKPRLVHDASIRNTRIDLALKTPRYICDDCGASFNHRFDFLVEGQCMTERLKEKIRQDCFSKTFTDMAIESGISEGTVRSICDKYWSELETNRGVIVAPRVLGIDEKHISHEMRAIFVNIETGRLLEIRPDNKEDDIVKTIESMQDYDKNIEIVTMDMANGYRSHVQLCLPKAKIIVDKYHVFQDLSRKIAKAKTGIMEEIGRQISEVAKHDDMQARHLRDVRDSLLRNPYLFKFGKGKLEEKENRLKTLADVCQTFPELNHLRLLKEGFERIYSESHSREQAEEFYEFWKQLLPPTRGKNKIAEWEKRYGVNASLYNELVSFGRAVEMWHTEIFNYFDKGCQFTNAASEGTNSKIQRINALGAGYGFKHLRARALFSEYVGPKTAYNFSTKELETLLEMSDLSLDNLIEKKKPHERIAPPKRRTVKRKERTNGIIASRSVGSVRKKRKPAYADELSVFAYINYDAEFYDFADES